MNEFFVIVGGGFLQVPMIQAAGKLGLQTVVLDRDNKAPGMQIADLPIQASTLNPDEALFALKEAASGLRLRGVATAGTDASYTVATIASTYGLPGIRPEDALVCSDKVLMRRRLREHGLPVPDFFQVNTREELYAAADHLGYPFVLKPTRNMGARGVLLIRNREEVQSAYHYSSKFASGASLIAESYMEGPELSVDALVWNEGFSITGIADRIIQGQPFFIEYGHNMPSAQDSNTLHEVSKIMQKAASALGISTGAAKGDIKLTPRGVQIGEIAARVSGGFMSTHTYLYHSGVDLMTAVCRIALGQDPGDLTPRRHLYALERAMLREPGLILDIDGLEEARRVDGVKHIHLNRNVGDIVEKPENNTGKVGNILATGRTKEEAEAAILEADSHIQIHIDDTYGISEKQIESHARLQLKDRCRVCDTCDGVRCSSGVPGMGGAGSMLTFRRNVSDLQQIPVTPSYIHDQLDVDTSTMFLGAAMQTPVMPAPISGLQTNMNGFLEEREYVRLLSEGASEKGSLAWLADGASPDRFKDVLGGVEDSRKEAILICKPRYEDEEIVERFRAAEKHSIRAVGIDIDSHGIATMRNRGIRTRTRSTEALAELRSQTRLPFIVKGVMTPEDALRAIEAGADAIVVSNHGGRVIDGLPSTISVLASIVEVVRGQVPVVVDGGFRSGSDVFKAIERGADAVLIGRPLVIAMAGGRRPGVKNYLQKITEELQLLMEMGGYSNLSAVKANARPGDSRMAGAKTL